MADINPDAGGAPRARPSRRIGEPPSDNATCDLDEASIGLVEMLFFAYRDFTGEADAVLEAYGFGRAHHRVLHFVSRRPGLRVADLLEILRITKQSLARVLKQLVDRGFIEQAEGADDRRARHLFLTDQGKALASRLARLQIDQVGRALAASGKGSEPAVQAFLTALIADPKADVVPAPAQHPDVPPGRGGPRDTRRNEP
jgi:DNA-binding MarR family transcriptional regulator